MSIRIAASCCHPLQESVVPRGARMWAEEDVWASVSTGMTLY
jgi:hypothetical protein